MKSKTFTVKVVSPVIFTELFFSVPTFTISKGGVVFALTHQLTTLPKDHTHYNRWCLIDFRENQEGDIHSIQENFDDVKCVISEEFYQ